MRIAIKFAYDGKKFQGYARQPDMKTVEGEIINLLVKNNLIKDPKESKFRSASRTDRDVSALGNVIAFNTSLQKKYVFQVLKKSSNDILFYGIKEVEPEFYPRYAKLRIYRYYLKNENLDKDEIIAVLALFAGEHNFSNFARIEENKDPIKTIDNIVVTERNDFFTIDFYAQNFLWHQIRRIISALEKALVGKIKKDQIVDALSNPNKKVDFGLAPAEPLILKDIVYDFEFEHDKKLRATLVNMEKQTTSFLEQ